LTVCPSEWRGRGLAIGQLPSQVVPFIVDFMSKCIFLVN